MTIKTKRSQKKQAEACREEGMEKKNNSKLKNTIITLVLSIMSFIFGIAGTIISLICILTSS